LAGPVFGMTLADASFFPSLAYMFRVGLRLEPRYPHLSAYFARLAARPSILATWPPHCKATPGLPILSS
jgi:glutathione S-transferase